MHECLPAALQKTALQGSRRARRLSPARGAGGGTSFTPSGEDLEAKETSQLDMPLRVLLQGLWPASLWGCPKWLSLGLSALLMFCPAAQGGLVRTGRVFPESPARHSSLPAVREEDARSPSGAPLGRRWEGRCAGRAEWTGCTLHHDCCP